MANFYIAANNVDEVLRALKENAEAALEACGQQAVSHSQQNITAAGRIDTSAMINSMNHLVQGDTCYVGTDIEYAIYNEMGTGVYIAGGRDTPWAFQDGKGKWRRTNGMQGIHFLKNAIANNVDEYKRIIIQYLES